VNKLFESPAPSFEAPAAADLMRKYFAIEGTAKALVSERDQNFRIGATDGQSYLLKIANAAESPDVVDYETAIVKHIASVDPEIPVPRVVDAIDGSSIVAVSGPDGASHLVRVLSWLDGTMLRNVEVDASARRQLGTSLAQLGLALRGFFHPAAAKPLLWDITQVANLADKVEHVEDPELRRICSNFISRFSDDIATTLKRMRAQVIYNDLNPSNVLVSEDASRKVSGIVDFGDTVHGPLICDVAVAAAYQLAADDDPFAGVLEFVGGYHSIVPLEVAELEVLLDLILARAVTTVIVTSWRAGIYPENREYILRNAEPAAINVRYLESLDRDRAFDRIRRACPISNSARIMKQVARDSSKLVKRRQELLGSAYRLFYERPIHVVQGENVWLHDADGRRYLDAYNNVPLVGHCHPHVVAALSEQAVTLNSHTRYLHDLVLDYAERLLALFPNELNRVMFGCTGSEANELALRIARAYTENTGVIATQFAYHGNTMAIAQLSPSYAAAEERADWVELIPPPDSYRGGSGQEGENAAHAKFLADIDNAIDRMAARGVAPAALILDAGFTSDGMFPPRGGLLSEAAKRVRAAGGIYIADEVQSGFNRFGKPRWGFELDDLVPDIVTLGKPIGNGHPLAATVIKDNILDVFSSKTRYFNTFGGNPVSAAVGLAVLDVFERDKLASNAQETGRYLHQQISALAKSHSLIGDVRGSGLFAGVELVLDQNPMSPATGATKRVVNAMRENGVLISMIGPNDNVLKIRPPLPFQRAHVDQLIETLDRCLLVAKENSVA